MKKWLIVLVVVFGFVGCRKRLYVHPTKTAKEFEREKFECRNESAAYAKNMGFDPVIHAMSGGVEECLQARGWVEMKQQEHGEPIIPATKSKYQE